MYISLKDSCSKGFNKWSDAYQSEIKKDVLADGRGEVVAADPGLVNRSMMWPAQPHHPALMPGPAPYNGNKL
jgi:hypothetical protein